MTVLEGMTLGHKRKPITHFIKPECRDVCVQDYFEVNRASV